MANASIAVRPALMVVGAVLLWRGVLSAEGMAATPAWTRLLQGASITLGALALIGLLRVRAMGPGRAAGLKGVASNLRACVLGVLLWLIPALVGIGACVFPGWASIELHASPGALIAAVLPLALGVFLIEALPEALLFRGFAQGLVGARHAAWIALLVQLLLFVAFAWLIGALHSPWQWMFIPGFALILGYARALSGNEWTCVGIHLAWMTTTQLLATPHTTVAGMQTLQFVAFALLPSATIGVVLGMRRPDFDWRRAGLR